MHFRTSSVLLVEDEPLDAAQVIRRIKKRGGVQVTVEHVTTLTAALEVIKRKTFDAALIDLHLSDSHGLSTISRFIEQAPQVAAIVLSGLTDEDTAQAAVREGAQDYIAKAEIEHVDVVKCIVFAVERQRLTDELRASRDREHLHAQFRSDFLAQMSHEIRTPMNGVIGMTSLLLASPALSPEDRERVEIIRSSGEALLSIVNDVLDLSKIEAGKVSIQAAEFDIRKVVEDCLESFAQVAAAKKVALVCQIEPEVPRRLSLDCKRLHQILSNLVSNGLKFTNAGYVCVRVALDHPAEPRLRFDVVDTGIGIRPEMITKLFAPFTQAELDHQYKGTGLGLAICKSLTELMGGRIGVESNGGGGSRFWFTVNFGQVAQPPQLDRPDLSHFNVAVVGGSCELNSLLKSVLEQRGFGTVSTHSPSSLPSALGFPRPQPNLVVLATDGLSREEISRWTVAPATLSVGFEGRQSAASKNSVKFPLRQSAFYQAAANILTHRSGVQDGPRQASSPQTLRRTSRAAEVLVVDDGEVNRKVVAQMLATLSHRVDLAEDGVEAIQKAHDKKYDLILMDCRMPKMSGIEATKHIRAGDSPNAGTPIVAMTANAFPEDRDQCKAAGMSDFLPKPVVLEDIDEVLRHWCNLGPSDFGRPLGPSAQETDNVIDLSTLQMLKRLDEGGAGGFLDDLINTFLFETPPVIDHLAEAIDRRDPEAVRHFAHKLKGFAHNLGAQLLAAEAAKIEGEPNAEACGSTVAHSLRDVFDSAVARLDQWRSAS